MKQMTKKKGVHEKKKIEWSQFNQGVDFFSWIYYIEFYCAFFKSLKLIIWPWSIFKYFVTWKEKET